MELEQKIELEKIQREFDQQIYKIDTTAFVDGIIDIEKYYSAPKKILWILKEPNSTEESLNWRNEIKNLNDGSGNLKGFAKTFSNIIYISNGILKKKKWNEINWIKDEPSIVSILEAIAFINIKKTPGGSVSNDKELIEYYQKYRDVVLNQITSFKPNIIIGGNSIKFLINDLKVIFPKLKDEKYIKTTDLGIFHSIEDDLIVFDAKHPNLLFKNIKYHEMYFSDIIENYLALSLKCY